MRPPRRASPSLARSSGSTQTQERPFRREKGLLRCCGCCCCCCGCALSDGWLLVVGVGDSSSNLRLMDRRDASDEGEMSAADGEGCGVPPVSSWDTRSSASASAVLSDTGLCDRLRWRRVGGCWWRMPCMSVAPAASVMLLPARSSTLRGSLQTTCSVRMSVWVRWLNDRSSSSIGGGGTPPSMASWMPRTHASQPTSVTSLPAKENAHRSLAAPELSASAIMPSDRSARACRSSNVSGQKR
mmetsp:Transcript_24226/g.69867  ORF Transcript_24226/g.69867 Transcript_24226/m.69867 type:complete len:242 (-) Transcript_24226:30-755(-)